MSKRTTGFTLIELMVTIVIVGILAAIAIPSFSAQVRKSRRAEAMQVLGDTQLRQENWRSSHATYGTTTQVPFDASAAILTSYTFALTTPSGNCANGTAASTSNSFILTATATGNQAADTSCATLVITKLCGVITKSSTGGGTCW